MPGQPEPVGRIRLVCNLFAEKKEGLGVVGNKCFKTGVEVRDRELLDHRQHGLRVGLRRSEQRRGCGKGR
ncbi:MAG: hypothetical protein IH985_02595 [Planctomycetes bacterium]|nr:hypothetical protein [Planctomycetota bacterium]